MHFEFRTLLADDDDYDDGDDDYMYGNDDKKNKTGNFQQSNQINANFTLI